MIGLTRLQSQMLDAIKARQVDGIGPSYDELRGDLGLSSKGEVMRILVGLRERGFVAWIPRCARSLHITAPAQTEGPSLMSFTDAALLEEIKRRGLQ
jgi:SOS-response transcriptional repressor LexA